LSSKYPALACREIKFAWVVEGVERYTFGFSHIFLRFLADEARNLATLDMLAMLLKNAVIFRIGLRKGYLSKGGQLAT
jgi:hypothetical protein